MDAIFDHTGYFNAYSKLPSPGERCAYVVGFGNGAVKVGMTGEPRSRFKRHGVVASRMSTRLNRVWISIPHHNARQTELDLMAFCRDHGAAAETFELFHGIDVERVIEYASARPLPGGVEASEATNTTVQYYLEREAFNTAFRRIATGGHSLTLTETAARLGLPLPSMSKIAAGLCPVNAHLVLMLVRFGFTRADLDAVLYTLPVHPNRGGNKRWPVRTAAAA